MTISIYSADDYIYRKLQLELNGFSDTVRCTDKKAADVIAEDGALICKACNKEIRISMPYPLGEVKKLFSSADIPAIILNGNGMVTAFGKSVKLTALEYDLLKLLIEKRSYVSQDEILKAPAQPTRLNHIHTKFLRYNRVYSQ